MQQLPATIKPKLTTARGKRTQRLRKLDCSPRVGDEEQVNDSPVGRGGNFDSLDSEFKLAEHLGDLWEEDGVFRLGD